MKEANKYGVTGTPTFFMNGRLLSGARSKADFERIIAEELRLAGR